MNTDINLLGAIPLGKIQQWQPSKQSGIIPIPLPANDAGGTEAIDGMGVVYIIRIRGRMTGTFQELQTNIYTINNIIDGFQDSAMELYSPYVNSSTFGMLATKIRRTGHLGVTTGTPVTNRLVDTSIDFAQLGIRAGDYVKNMRTGQRALVTSAGITFLNISDNIFPTAGTEYAVTAHIKVKLVSFNHDFEIPGQRIVDYTLEVVQVRW